MENRWVLDIRPEDSHRGWGGDVLRQTVLNTSSGDRKSSVTDGGQSSTAYNRWWRRGGMKSLTSLNVRHLTEFVDEQSSPVSTAFSQWSWWRSGVMWWNFDDEKMSRAAVFIADCSRDKRYDETPSSVALPLSSRERTTDDTNDWRTNLDSNRRIHAFRG